MIFFMHKLEHKERQQATLRSCDDCRMPVQQKCQIVEKLARKKAAHDAPLVLCLAQLASELASSLSSEPSPSEIASEEKR